MAHIAVIGGAGYLGIELVKQLRKKNHDVKAVTHSNGRFLLGGTGAIIVAPEDIGHIKPVDIVINLAYPNSGSIHRYPELNRSILKQIKTIAGNQAKIIHTSTQAVFGFGMEYKQVAGPVPFHRDYLYIETKIFLERLLCKYFYGRDLQIVRLGNIWGPASAGWTAPLANRILFMRPVSIDGIDGYSNITDVANAASYLVHLCEKPTEKRTAFHHLAELGEIRWSYWIERISRLLGTKPVAYRGLLPYPDTVSGELRSIYGSFSFGKLYKAVMSGRFAGSLGRRCMRMVPKRTFEKVKKSSAGKDFSFGQVLADDDQPFLKIMSAEKLFKNNVDKEWRAPIDLDSSGLRVEKWLKEVGFVRSARIVP